MIIDEYSDIVPYIKYYLYYVWLLQSLTRTVKDVKMINGVKRKKNMSTEWLNFVKNITFKTVFSLCLMIS